MKGSVSLRPMTGVTLGLLTSKAATFHLTLMHGIQTGSKTGMALTHTSFTSSFGFQGVLELSFPPTPKYDSMT